MLEKKRNFATSAVQKIHKLDMEIAELWKIKNLENQQLQT